MMSKSFRMLAKFLNDFVRRSSASSASRPSRLRFRPRVEGLEERIVPWSVMNNADDGVGSFRWAIEQANASAAPSEAIDFPGVDLTNPITLLSPLPAIEKPMTISAAARGQGIGVFGTDPVTGAVVQGDGLDIGAPQVTVAFLTFEGFGGDGIKLEQVLPQGDEDLESCGAAWNTGNGLTVESAHNTVSVLISSWNGGDGIALEDAHPSGRNNLDSDIVYSNGGDGLKVSCGSNTISAGDFYGNTNAGVHFDGTDAWTNVLTSSTIGLDPNELPNLGDGILMDGGATQNTIGGADGGEGNVIVGNQGDGIKITGAASGDSLIAGNYIGIFPGPGNYPQFNNLGNGIAITDGAGSNTIGSTSDLGRNFITGNYGNGISLDDASGDVILGNYIGLDDAGSPFSNNGNGIEIDNNSLNEKIGVDNVGNVAPNVISANNEDGIKVSGSQGTQIFGNYIGLFAPEYVGDGPDGSPGNQGEGVELEDVTQTQVGSALGSTGNFISGNIKFGVSLSGASTFNSIQGNLIGTDASGTMAIGNGEDGIHIDGGSWNVIGGGSAADQRNVISGNSANGIDIAAVIDNSNSILGNYIGTDITGTAALGNVEDGILIEQDSHDVTIGGVAGYEPNWDRNIVSGNQQNGIEVEGSSNTIENNYVGTDVSGENALGNFQDGVVLSSAATGNSIGDETRYSGNLISGNGGNGVKIEGSTNLVMSNFIGTNLDGSQALGNANDGILLTETATSNSILGTAEAPNVISANGNYGIEVLGASNSFDYLIVGLALDGVTPLPNTNGWQSGDIGGNTWGTHIVHQ